MQERFFTCLLEFPLCCFRTEVDTYNALDPGMRVIILKALCDIRVEVFFLQLCHLEALHLALNED